MARKSTIKSTIDTVAQALIIDVQGTGKLTLRMADVSPACATYAMLHGFKQRIVDAAALSRDETNGRPATEQEKFDAMARLVEHYASGTTEWALRTREGGETGGLTLRALADVQGVDVETMRERVERNAEKRGQTVKAYLAAVAKIPAVRERMDALRPAPAIDAEELLGELTDAEGDEGIEDEGDDE